MCLAIPLVCGVAVGARVGGTVGGGFAVDGDVGVGAGGRVEGFDVGLERGVGSRGADAVATGIAGEPDVALDPPPQPVVTATATSAVNNTTHADALTSRE